MSVTARHQVFSAVHTVGGLLPADMLTRIAEGKDVPGSKPADYGVVGARSVADDAERHWDYLAGVWRELRARLPEDPETGAPAADPTGRAVSDWLAPLFNELGFGRLTALGRDGLAVDDKAFPISHRWRHVLLHFAPWASSLDKRHAGEMPAQSMVQEFLNRTEAHLWGVLTNGRQLRLLRDSSALATASYVEFDLEAIFDGELFSEFVLLYRLLHVSRFDVPEGSPPSACWLEKWRTEAIQSGTRALERLREGVRTAITILGTGFLRHPDNDALRANLDVETLHHALLRLVYRLLFLFVAEDRDVLLPREAPEPTKDRYTRYFSSARLRRHAQRRRGTAHGDLYRALLIVLNALGNEEGRPELGLPGLGGIFDDTDADRVLHGLMLSNESLLAAVRALSIVRDAGSRRNRVVDYRHLGAEELGSIYESLLELVPKHSASERSFELVELPGNARKTTGSYYTPTSLIDCLLDSALDPVIDDAVKRGEIRATRSGQPDAGAAIEAELLSLTVCDPACGSGHFLVAAARRIAKRLAAVRERNPEPTLDAVRRALRDVVARCIYGVDVNPMAVELAKVSLWLEALERGKPLGFLDAHVKCGNALIGATPALLAGGIPDDAFKPIEGDDRIFAAKLKKLNAIERSGQYSFRVDTGVKVPNRAFASGLRSITAAPADTLRDVHNQADGFRALEENPAYRHARHLADAWCAAFVWPKTADAPAAITDGAFCALADPKGFATTEATHHEINRLAQQYRFFHWHLEFPEVFHVPPEPDANTEPPGWSGGFSCILGNPPWERIKLQEQEFFAQRDTTIADAPNAAARKKLIAGLLGTQPDLYEDFLAAKRRAEGESQFLRSSQRYPLTGRGDINTYAVFAETDRALVGPTGRVGAILPTGIATDATTQYFFKDLVQCGSIASLYDFENRSGLFPAVDSRMKFSLLTLTGRGTREAAATFAFFLHDSAELDEPGKRFALTPEEITLLNPNTGTCPIFRSRRDAEITLGIYRRVPVLLKEGDPNGNPWGLSFMRMFDMSNDSHLFHTRDELERDGWTLTGNIFTKADATMLPLYEAKMIDFYNHRAADVVKSETAAKRQNQPSYLDVADWQDASRLAMPCYWVAKPEMDRHILAKGWGERWLLGWRDITSVTNERTVISAAIPATAVGDKYLLALPSDRGELLLANLSSFVFDYAARQKVGGTSLKFFTMSQLPCLPKDALLKHSQFITPRILEATYTADDMVPFARDLGDTGGPFRWDEYRRAIVRAELDALFFHLYSIARDDVDYISETFPIVKRKDEAKYGTYRTKDLILSIYDRMATAGVGLESPLVDGENFTSTLNPPPGHGPRHPARN
jgi:hypothetical protein